MVYAYVQLSERSLASDIEGKLGAFLAKHLGESRRENVRYRLQPLTEIHLHSSHIKGFYQPQSDVSYIYIFSAIGLFIVLIAVINFMNLTTARSADRVKEIGMRKVLGAQRFQLVKQFLSEAILSSLVAFLVALLLVKYCLPVFNGIRGMNVSSNLPESLWFWFVMLCATLLLGVISRSYPAVVLSAFLPVSALKGESSPGSSGAYFRMFLVVIQISIATVLIIGTAVIYNQLAFIKDKNLGFNQDQLIAIPKVAVTSQQRDELFKTVLMQNPSISRVSDCLAVPGKSFTMPSYAYLAEGAAEDASWSLQTLFVDHDYLETLGVKILAGRGFSREFATDEEAFIINESAAKQFGWNEPLGKYLTWQVATGAKGMTTWKRGPVVGVIENFHTNSLHQAIGPVVLHIWPQWHGFYLVRLGPENIKQTVTWIEDKWADFFMGRPLDYFFLDENFANLYKSEERFGNLFGYFAALAILIACLGLFGLASYTAERKTKEIGIHKVLGADASGIVGILSKEFFILVIIANFIAWPTAYVVMNQWLQHFAYRVELDFRIFLFSGILILLISMITVSSRAIKAALSNPVEALKYE